MKVHQQEKAAPAAKPAMPAETDAELEARYVAQLNALVDDAADRRKIPVFVNAAAWKLAVIAHRCGTYAAGDILRLFGEHVCALAEKERAAREAEQARSDGRQPH